MKRQDTRLSDGAAEKHSVLAGLTLTPAFSRKERELMGGIFLDSSEETRTGHRKDRTRSPDEPNILVFPKPLIGIIVMFDCNKINYIFFLFKTKNKRP